MKEIKPQLAHGQTLVLFAVALIGLIGFVALAIDGGMLYSARRFDQNAADASALAGAIEIGKYFQEKVADMTGGISPAEYFRCDTGSQLWLDAKQAGIEGAIDRAISNSFNDINPANAPNIDDSVYVECATVTENGITSRVPRVHVQIYEPVNTSLIQIFYKGVVANRVNAIADIYAPADFGGGNGIASLSPYCRSPNSSSDGISTAGGIFYDGGGSNEIRIYDGGVFSNSCLDAAGGVIVNSMVDGPPGGYITSDSTILYVGTNPYNPQCIVDGENICFNPDPKQVSDPLLTIPYPVPQQCRDTASHIHDTSGTRTLDPGIYLPSGNSTVAISIKNNEVVSLKPGLYCLYGDFDAGGGELRNIDYSLSRNGVTIIMVQGKFNIGGNVHVTLTAPYQDGSTGAGEIPGLLLYMPPENSAQSINMGGSAGSVFSGTVYGPKALIDVGGNQSTESIYNTQIVGWVIKVHGNVSINITYDAEVTALISSRMDLAK